MSDELEDKESKTEEPSQKKLDDALEKGQIAYSRELTSFLMLLALCIVISFILPYTISNVAMALRGLVEHSFETSVNPGIGGVFVYIFNKALFALVPVFVFLIFVILLSSFMQNGQFIFAPDQITPKLSRISVMEGAKRLFSLRSVMEFFKGIFKVALTGVIIYFVVLDDVKIMNFYPQMAPDEIIHELFKVIKDILIAITVVMFVIGVADFFYQKYEYIKNLMMSRQDLKEEYKQTEGHPEVKKKQRQLRHEKAQNRMMTKVPEADVIITNPEHYSIALSYDGSKMQAPIVVAKGLDIIAMKIREIAKEHDIPIIENPPLARALYLVDLEKEIPIEHYEAVAEIIGYVYKLKKKKHK